MSQEIYDSHVHFGPSTQWVPYVDPVVSIEDVLEKMGEHGIAKSVVFPNPHVGDRYPELNDLMSSAQRDNPENIIAFGRVDPRRGSEAVDEIRRIHRMGLSGLKLHPYVECFRPDHPFFQDMFGELNELDMTILIHTGTMFSSPGYLKEVLNAYPQMRIILGHLQEGCVPLMRNFENVYSDTSGCRVKLLEYACETCEDKILFGSDYPYLSHRVQMEVVRAAEISMAAKDGIFKANLTSLLSR